MRECDQVIVQNPDHAMDLDGEVCRLVQVIDELQRWRMAPRWRIMLDNASPLSDEIMSIVIPLDFRFSDLKYLV